mmetsp:Transcript_69821/g.195201  ORF Transcript_69821/g.195201 Transcript_69821/m.195201 type:complete len:185 (+) Transcript_69821:899-1453(+)
MTMAELWEHLESHPESYFSKSKAGYRSLTPALRTACWRLTVKRSWKEFVREDRTFPLLHKVYRPGSSIGVAVLIVLRGAPSTDQTPTDDSPMYANAFVLGAGVAENDLRVTVTFELKDGQKAVLTTKAKPSSGNYDHTSNASDGNALHPSDRIGIPASMIQPLAGEPKGEASASLLVRMEWLAR